MGREPFCGISNNTKLEEIKKKNRAVEDPIIETISWNQDTSG